MRKEQLLVPAVVACTAALGYFGLLSPQQSASAALRGQVTQLEADNAGIAAQLPALKGELDTINGQVDVLRSLSSQVPPEVNQPELFAELAQAAAEAGLPGGAEGVNVGIPVLVAQEPVAGADAVGTTQAAPVEGDPTQSTATIASFEVTLTVKGTTGQTIGFLQALKRADRLSIVSSSTLTVDAEGQASLAIKAVYYLQQVNVDGLVSEIEALTNAASVPSGDVTVPVDDTSAAKG